MGTKDLELNIIFKDGTDISYRSYDYTDYSMENGFFIIRYEEKVKAMYNLDIIAQIIPPKY